MPGDRVAVTGIYRAGSIRLNYNRRNVKSVYRTHIDAIHFNKNQSHLSKTIIYSLGDYYSTFDN